MQRAMFSRARLGAEATSDAYLSWAGYDANGVPFEGTQEIHPNYLQEWAAWKYWTLRLNQCRRFSVLAGSKDGRHVEYSYP